MRATGRNAWWIGAGASALATLALAACATGVDPVRPGAGGAGTSGTVVGSTTGDGPTTSATAGGGGDPSTTTGNTTAATTGDTTGATSGDTTGATSGNTTGATTGSTTAASTSATTAASTSASTSGAGGGPVMGLSVEYLCSNTNANTQQIQPHFKVVNNSGAAVALSSLKVRYYYTNEGNPPPINECDYALVGCANVTAAFAASAGVNTDHYLELGFSAGAGSVSPGGDSGEVQARIHNQDFSALNQTNDYSYDPTKTAFTTWDHVTLYQNGSLAWGKEP